MNPEPAPSIAAALWALILALVIAGLVSWGDWTPWEAMLVVVGGALTVSLVGLVSLMAMARNRSDRADLWKSFADTARADLQPFVVLWRFLRGRRR